VKRFLVRLTAGAEGDLAAIHAYIAESDGKAAADRVLRRLLDLSDWLSRMPERGSFPRELLSIGMHDYRQILLKPYRVIYRLRNETVYIVLLADARRDMQTLLTERLLRGS
jgi:toxin ParE1/3/4